MKYQGFCFPTCPDNYETKDNYCIKPKGHKYKKFYHDGFLKKAVSQWLTNIQQFIIHSIFV